MKFLEEDSVIGQIRSSFRMSFNLDAVYEFIICKSGNAIFQSRVIDCVIDGSNDFSQFGQYGRLIRIHRIRRIHRCQREVAPSHRQNRPTSTMMGVCVSNKTVLHQYWVYHLECLENPTGSCESRTNKS